VRLATHKKCKINVAIKTYDKNTLEDPVKFKNIKREIAIMGRLKHPNIIKLYQAI
jgi:serine/threonine protein kinase